jgi:sortase A
VSEQLGVERIDPPRQPPALLDRILGIIGELSMTLGVVLLLFVPYQLWWTNLSADRAAEETASALRQDWASDQATGASDGADDAREPGPSLGSAFALAYIPRLRDSVWGLPVNEGVDMSSLARGLGHYPQTAVPGEVGNTALAGHRATNGEPLRDVDRLRAGDEVILETASDFFVYTLQRDQIVAPDDTWVIDPVPGRPDATPEEPLLTLTTCNPRWASFQRWVWWGTLTERLDKSTGDLPDALADPAPPRDDG